MGLLSSFSFGRLEYDRDSVPLPASIVLVELWKETVKGGYYVKVETWGYARFHWLSKVLYRRDGILLDTTKSIKGCAADNCAFDVFVQRSAKYQPKPSVDAVRQNAPGLTKTLF